MSQIAAKPHPAAVAWQYYSGGQLATHVTELHSGKGRQVFCIHNCHGARNSQHLIAKKQKNKLHYKESFAYKDILTKIDLLTPGYLGETSDNDDASWLFLEHVQGVGFRSEDHTHRELAGTYLARLHSEGKCLVNLFDSLCSNSAFPSIEFLSKTSVDLHTVITRDNLGNLWATSP